MYPLAPEAGNIVTHQLIILALKGIYVCMCDSTISEGVAHVLITNPTPFLFKWCRGQGVADFCPLLALNNIFKSVALK